MNSHNHPEKLVDHLFRHEYGKMVSILIRIFGPSRVNLVEDVIQEAFIKAIGTWRHGKIPDNPAAWLHRVAKNKAIDIIRSENSRSERNKNYHGSKNQRGKIDEMFLDEEIADSQLRLIFTLCKLDINEEDKIALTLKLISGFGIKEIAKALVLNEETVKKRIHRARKKLKEQNETIEIPSGRQLSALLMTVHTIIYLIFNEGYNSSRQSQLIRKDLCVEAMRLGKLIAEHPYCNSEESYALMALMCYHAARLDSRVGIDKELILLEDQDRTKWYRPLINIGHHYMSKCGKNSTFSIYHLEAAIAACHCEAQSFEETDWEMLGNLYTILYKVKPMPSVMLNLAVVRIQEKRFDEAMKLIKELRPSDFAPNPYLFYAVASKVLESNNMTKDAIFHLQQALNNVVNDAERQLLEERLSALATTA